MKKGINLVLMVLVMIIIGTSCSKNRLVGTGSLVNQEFNITDFSKVELSMGNATVNYTKSNDYYVEVNAQQNVIDKMKIKKAGDELRLGFESLSGMVKYEHVTFTVHSPDFDGADVSGSGDIYVEGDFSASNVKLAVSGSGKIDIDEVEATDVNADISGSGKISARGTADRLDTKISGSGKMYFEAMKAKTVKTKTSGSGRTNVWATETLDVDISGSGNVYYKGTPTLDVDISGSGKVKTL